jgi:hypothetical protein
MALGRMNVHVCDSSVTGYATLKDGLTRMDYHIWPSRQILRNVPIDVLLAVYLPKRGNIPVNRYMDRYLVAYICSLGLDT